MLIVGLGNSEGQENWKKLFEGNLSRRMQKSEQKRLFLENNAQLGNAITKVQGLAPFTATQTEELG